MTEELFLRERVKKDWSSADFQLSLLHSALISYRHDSVLRPFPPMFNSPGTGGEVNKQYEDLKEALNGVQSIKQLQSEAFLSSCDKRLIQLLHWTLNAKNFTLETCPKDKFSVILELTGQITDVPPPNYIYQVCYKDTAEERFKLRQGDKPLMYAYHGSRMENFHCILHHGLNSHMTKNAFFGEGTYLSSELAVSMPYAPCGQTWKHSLLGDKLGCIAVCEIIDDPSVKCQTKDSKDGTNKSRAHAPNSMGGEVPEKYYIVRNNEVIRVKYLLVYVDAGVRKRTRHKVSFLQQHKFAVMIVVYVLLLLCIGLYNSRLGQSFIRKWRS